MYVYVCAVGTFQTVHVAFESLPADSCVTGALVVMCIVFYWCILNY